MPSHVPFRKWLKILAKIFLGLLLILVLIIASGIAFIAVRSHQTVMLPTPTGPYAVGRMEYDWTDQSREDSLAPRPGTKRELVVWAWYPAVRPTGAQTAPYLPPKWGDLNDQQHSAAFGLKIVQSYDSIQTHSFAHAQLATNEARYPVLIFEPGMGNIPAQYTTLIEDLASHGYIIFAINPTYSANMIVFPDGRVAEATNAGKPGDNDNLEVKGNKIVSVWARDVIFTMNQLEHLNATAGNMWSQHLDLTRLGIFGHSFGGATSAQVCHMDTRCKAGIDLDGTLLGDVLQTGLTKPFMVIQSEENPCDADCHTFQQGVQAILRTVPAGEAYHLNIKDTRHFNFSDYAAYFSPLRLLDMLGPIDGVRGLQITRAYVRAFFDKYLNNTPSPLLQGPTSAYPEVQFFKP
ncbi:alpha/beta hydrolase [Ktedonosporobacter rubrisoli]|uniref:Alpha/beta hydrolase n=1 Tax=Ktedonosporobacter rubrisoli TaxID=2509675 RepID=A0A4P6JNH6_KTERU|nr:alpha/beta hydrolase [Ktedonosporobacter rubrisoli]QBD76723.1 alpha/beta hydrolase [Ktedonosporobacter rubrisoli]